MSEGNVPEGSAPYSISILATCYVRNPNVHWTVLDNEAVLVSLESGFYYTLNKVGRVAWELFSEARTLSEIVRAISTRFEVAEEQAQTDIYALVKRLREEQLVETVA